MTTSCDAEMNATSTASSANTRVAWPGEVADIHSSAPASASSVITSQLRRRPSHGSSKRSISGAQRNLKVYGSPTMLRKPMVAMSTPSAVSQACMAWPVSASGRPEAKPRRVTTVRRCSATRSTRDDDDTRSTGALMPRLSQLEVVVDHHRRVIREALLEIDRLAHGGAGDARRGQVVVDAPAHVLRPRLAAVAPPGVLLGVRVERTEHVDQADAVERMRP